MFGNLFSNSKNKRCPKCGNKNSQKMADNRSKGEVDLMAGIKAQMNQMNPDLARYNKETGRFECQNCNHQFSGAQADEWERIAKKLGEDVAIRQYSQI